MPWKMKPTADNPTVKTNASQRAMARIVDVEAPTAPGTPAESDLLGDVFQSLYQHQPEVRDGSNVNPDRAVNRAVMDYLIGDKSFQDARGSTAGRILGAAAATGMTWEAARSDETIKELLGKQKEAEKEMAKAENLREDAVEQLEKGNKSTAEAMFQNADMLEQHAEELVKEAVEKVEKLKDSPMGGAIAGYVAEQAQEAAEEANSIAVSFGLDPAQATIGDAQQIAQVAQNKTVNIPAIAAMVGRLKGIASRTLETKRHSSTSPVTEVALTKDITQISPIERAYLSPNAPRLLRRLKLVELVETGLMGSIPYENPNEAGDFIAYCDTSGSMQWTHIADVTALNVALGLCAALGIACADDEDRQFRLKKFSDSVYDMVDNSSRRMDFLRWVSQDTKVGGTDIDAVIQDAMREVELRKDDQAPVDILVITDDWSYVEPETERKFLELKAETGCRLLTILIGTDRQSALAKLSTACIPIKALDGDGLDAIIQAAADMLHKEG